jgi:CRISPR-associated protein Csx14
MKKRTVLIAILGGQPQVVTFALDLLLVRGELVDEVAVVHLGRERYLRALRRLGEAFPGDRYAGRRCHLRPVPIYAGERLGILQDIRTERDVAAVWRTIHELIRQLKEDRAHVHLLLAGGRRMMAMLAVSTAMLQLEPGDFIWHLYTPDEVQQRARDGAILHAPDAGIELLQVPVAMLGSYFPAIRALMTVSPEDVLTAQTRWLSQDERGRCLSVWRRLTLRQQDVLRAFAQGMGREEVAALLSVSIRTVDSHKSRILDECRVIWELPESERLDYHFIYRHFEPCLSQLGRL